MAAIARFLMPDPLPKRLLYVEPLRWRMMENSFVLSPIRL